ncbi:MAG: HYR domain-containing protein, partial [Flavobacteriales bacterium]|nr:HYR domain-containing protein [Flavobacteriales bacterium]
ADGCGLISYECTITNEGNIISGPTATQSGASATFDFSVGTSTVSYLASDAAGNTWTCSFTVTVFDDEDPTAICQDAVVLLGPDGTGSIAADGNDPNTISIDGGSSDNCGYSWSVSQSQFDCNDLGENTVTLTVVDEAGNSVNCDATVTVVDQLPPTIDCVADATVNTSDDGTDGDCNYVVGTEFDPLFDDNTSPGCALTLTNDHNGGSSLNGESFSAADSPFTINWTVEDSAGNTATCSTTITVLDQEAPSFSYCPEDIELDALTGNCLALVSWVEPTLDDVIDNCEVASLEGPFVNNLTVEILPQSNGSAFGNFPIGETLVTYLVTDIYGNTSVCEFSVIIVDNEDPLVLDFQEFYDLPFDPLYCGALVDVAPPVAFDYCGELTYHCDYTNSDSGLDVYPAGEETIVNWTVTDESGNSIVLTAIVNVDKIGPASNLQAVCRPDKNFVKLKFDPAEGAQRYLIQVREPGGGPFLWVERNYNADVTVAYLPMDSLPPGDYEWRVVSLCKMDDAENLPGWQEYTKRYTKWINLELPCSISSLALQPEESEGISLSKLGETTLFDAEIFPNPNTGVFNIRTDLEMYNLDIMDAEGSVVYHMERITDQFMEMDLDGLNNGIYLVRFYNDDIVITKRVTIQK